MGRTVRFHAPAEEVVQAVTAALARRGVRLVRSFDLQAARARHPDPEDCACPQHGTAECTCQYVVALAYPPPRAGRAMAPQVLTAHTYGQVTLVTLHADQEAGNSDRHTAGNSDRHTAGNSDRHTVMAAVLEAAGDGAPDPCRNGPDPCPEAAAEQT